MELDAIVLGNRHWMLGFFRSAISIADAVVSRVLPIAFPLRVASVRLFSGGAATRSVPERADEHVRAEHGEGLRVGHHEAM